MLWCSNEACTALLAAAFILAPAQAQELACSRAAMRLAGVQLEWREWMTGRLTCDYLTNQAFYRMQTDVVVDNPDQRIASDIRCAIWPVRAVHGCGACVLERL